MRSPEFYCDPLVSGEKTNEGRWGLSPGLESHRDEYSLKSVSLAFLPDIQTFTAKVYLQ